MRKSILVLTLLSISFSGFSQRERRHSMSGYWLKKNADSMRIQYNIEDSIANTVVWEVTRDTVIVDGVPTVMDVNRFTAGSKWEIKEMTPKEIRKADRRSKRWEKRVAKLHK